MDEYKSPLDTIAAVTAKTVTEVSKIYHEKYPNKKDRPPEQKTKAYPFSKEDNRAKKEDGKKEDGKK